MPLSSLHIFVEVCKHHSMKKTADILCVTPGAISQQIKSLEDRMSVKLFERSHREISLTTAGKNLMDQLAVSFNNIEAVWEDFESFRTRSARLSVNTTLSFASAWLIPRLTRFQQRWPDIEINLSTSHCADLRRDGIDVAIRHGQGVHPGHHSEKLWTPNTLPIGHPALLKTGRRIEQPADCLNYPLLQDASRSNWKLWLKAHGIEDTRSRRGCSFTDEQLLIDAAIAGQGLALVSDVYARPAIKAGHVVPVFAPSTHAEMAYYLISPLEQADDWKINIFANWIKAEVSLFLKVNESSAQTRQPDYACD
ncbi:LysR substrate-binding domain-containing protein [Pseudomonas citrulli]|uniref:LysR substrate-binding domain-containing protein n=1 Tax=Pseudomonas citrulli TaxID=3064347 RepID=A0ABT9BVF2_9PSED|nr:LysR substrate-binding domain-containing protein [Pseudomonas sp. K18]MDO7896186.1 LysR substrate-binding domain-containing protein [Pseudomonas sp. K18]